MPRFAYVNGRYVHHRDAAVHIEDRGYQFADGVYEVIPVHRGTLVDEALHLDRLAFSLSELRIAMPMSRQALRLVAYELMRRNDLTNGFIYMQVTRGVAPRDHKFPKAAKPALTMTTRQLPAHEREVKEGFRAVSVPDQRWTRRDIKSISLLPNILAKQAAADSGCQEAWQVDEDGYVTEGSATSAWIVTADKKVVTRQANNLILSGITRLSLIKVLEQQGYTMEVRPFTLEEAYNASEAFLTSSTNYVMPITELDGRPIGNGHPGLLTLQLRGAYMDRVVEEGGGAESFRAYEDTPAA
jgi:D-alanine transaminase